MIALQLPFVQDLITDKVETIAAETLGTDLGIGRIRVDFPNRVDVTDVYVNNPAGDSIVRLGHLGVGINMWALLRSTAEITDVAIDDVYANVITTDSSSNIQFLLDAFLPAVDTLAAKESPAADSVAASEGGWLIDAAGATFDLTNADIYYQDDPTGILADIQARRLSAALEEIDLNEMNFGIDHLDLEGTNARIGIGESSTPTDTTVTASGGPPPDRRSAHHPGIHFRPGHHRQ